MLLMKVSDESFTNLIALLYKSVYINELFVAA